LVPGDKRLLGVALPAGAQFWFAFVNQSSVWPWEQKDQILIPLDQQPEGGRASEVEFFYTLPTRRASGRSLVFELDGPKFDLPLENIAWRVFVNGRWQLKDWKGSLQLAEQAVVDGRAMDLQDYVQVEAGRKQQQIKTAEEMLAFGNTLLQQGDPQQARRAFQRAYGLSQHDNAFNEDARVQLHNLKMQQTLVGLNARQAAIANDASAPAAQVREVQDGEAPRYTQEQAKQILDRNSAEDNAVLMRLAERLVQQQDAAVPNPAAIRASVPEEGRLLTFKRTLLVDPWAELKLQVVASTPATRARLPQFATVATVAALLGLLLALARRPAERP
jgi:hypothetical protein